MLELCFRKNINALSGFLSSAAGMHSWNIIFTLNLTPYQTRTHLHFKLSNLGRKKWGRKNLQLQYVFLLVNMMYFAQG